MARNRKKLTKSQHRQAAERYAKSDMGHWVRRTIAAFKDNAEVQRKLLAGHFDVYLPKPQADPEIKESAPAEQAAG